MTIVSRVVDRPQYMTGSSNQEDVAIETVDRKQSTA